MRPGPRHARVRALAKINLHLRVLHQRRDRFHELRTVYQTISLADTLDIAFAPARKTSIALEGSLDAGRNLVAQAAEMALDAMRITGQVDFRLHKKIPLQAGLGGGSSDAAAVLLALPVLAGGAVELDLLIRMASELGSDVPFFLLGGTAVGLGRGDELYPLPDLPSLPGIVLAPQVQISTASAYQRLSPRLTTAPPQNTIVSFQSRIWGLSAGGPGGGVNDFESVAFERFPQLGALKRRLLRLGAQPALMTGSGSALFGLFRSREQVNRALRQLSEDVAEGVFPISLVSRARYQSLWRRWLRAHTNENLWPPQSRYAQ